MEKEKHKWEKINDQQYVNMLGETHHHFVIRNEYYRCKICGLCRLSKESK